MVPRGGSEEKLGVLTSGLDGLVPTSLEVYL